MSDLDGDKIGITDNERQLYDRVSREAATVLANRICAGDIIILHDPQTLGMAPYLQALNRGIIVVFRSHIGIDRVTPATKVAWKFLKPFAKVVAIATLCCSAY